MIGKIFEFFNGLRNYNYVPPKQEPAHPAPANVFSIPGNSSSWKGIVLHHCLRGDSLVTTSMGPKKIRDISTSDSVLCFDASLRPCYRKVAGSWHSGVKEVFMVRTPTRTLFASGNHPLLSLVRPGKSGGNQYTPWHRKKLDWVSVDSLARGSYVAVVTSEPDRDEDARFSDDFLQLVGFFIGDGSMKLSGSGYSPSSAGGQITFHAIAAAKRPYFDIAKRVYGADVARLSDRGISVYRKEQAEIYNSLGLYKSREKEVPGWIFNLSKRQRLMVLRGITDSVGSVDKRGGIRFRFANEGLTRQVRALAISCGVHADNIKFSSENISFNGYNYTSHLWGFQCSRQSDNILIGSNRADFSSRINSKLTTRRTGEYRGEKVASGIRTSLASAGLSMEKVRSIESVGYDDVYDIEVEGSHNFVADGVLVHNSATKDNPAGNDWEAIRRYHMSWRVNGNIVTENEYYRAATSPKNHCEKPWSGIGYHLGIERTANGLQVRIGRPWNKAGAHAGFKETNKYNETYLGFCLVGNYDVVPPDAETMELCLAVTRQIMHHFAIEKENVIGHRETYDRVGVPRKKTCPGSSIDLDLFRSRL